MSRTSVPMSIQQVFLVGKKDRDARFTHPTIVGEYSSFCVYNTEDSGETILPEEIHNEADCLVEPLELNESLLEGWSLRVNNSSHRDSYWKYVKE